jgi:hypothetical protein
MEENTPEQPIPKKPGPQTGHWAEVIKMGIVIGRNKIAVPPDEVEHQASLGCTDRDIATYFGVKEDTLRRHFAEYLIKGRHNLKTSLRQAQLRAALENLNPALLIFLGKNLLGQGDSGIQTDENRALPWNDEPVTTPIYDDDIVDVNDISTDADTN